MMTDSEHRLFMFLLMKARDELDDHHIPQMDRNNQREILDALLRVYKKELEAYK